MTISTELIVSVGINLVALGACWGTIWTRQTTTDKKIDNIEKKLGITSNGNGASVVTKNECFLMESLVRERLTNIERRLTDIEETLRSHTGMGHANT